MKRNLLLLLLAGMVLLAVAPGAVADPLSVTKLVGRYKLPQINPGLGLSIAVNDRYIVCGERGNDDRGLNAGAAQVYDARTGRYLRTLFGTDTAAGDTFGESVAVFGNMALVGATGANGAGGKAYLFDLRRGKQTMVLEPSDLGPGLNFGRTVALGKDTAFVGTPIRGGKGAVYRFDLATLAETIVEASDGVADDDFGGALDLEGRWLLVGAPQESTSTGKAYLIDTESLDELAIFTPGDGAAMDFFGNSVALDGDFALLGAPGHDSAGAEAGAAYLYQISNGMQLHKFDGNAAGDFFGQAVAMDENRIAIGAGEADFLGLNTVGEVELFDRRTTASLGVLHSHDRQTSHRFGTYLALCGNRLVVGVPGDTRNASLLGAIYLHSPVVGPLPLARVAALRDFA
ncbi:MAG: hypothetical protein KDM91_16780, partial [Verrucomicrobiae bacterium]|nr:hypothetical protein [Verrucomicrobiae bacterium]